MTKIHKKIFNSQGMHSQCRIHPIVHQVEGYSEDNKQGLRISIDNYRRLLILKMQIIKPAKILMFLKRVNRLLIKIQKSLSYNST